MKDCHSSVLTVARLISDNCASLVCVQLAKMLELGKAVLTLNAVDAALDTFRTRTRGERLFLLSRVQTECVRTLYIFVSFSD